MLTPDLKTVCPESREAWRKWLEQNHDSSPAVWLIYYKKASGIPSITYSDAVDEALCFGWIDSVRKTLDDNRFIQFFSKRKVKSVWSKVNKAKVARLIEDGLMSAAGYKSIETAKENGSWTILDEAEEGVIPADLTEAFSRHPRSADYFSRISPSARKAILQWLIMAKRPETRAKRIAEIAMLAADGLKPKQFQ